jgi:hypothetical protein
MTTKAKDLRSRAHAIELDWGQTETVRLLRESADELERLESMLKTARAKNDHYWRGILKFERSLSLDSSRWTAGSIDEIDMAIRSQKNEIERLRRVRPDPSVSGIRIMVELTIGGDTVGAPAFLSETFEKYLLINRSPKVELLEREVRRMSEDAGAEALDFALKRRGLVKP